MLQVEKKYLSAGLNTDDADFAVGESELINGLNIRFGTTENGAVGYLESVPGTTALYQQLPFRENLGSPGVDTIIGSVADEARRRLLFAVYNSLGHNGIFAYDYPTNTTYMVLDNANLINGLAFISGKRVYMKVVGDLLYFLDSNGVQCRVNIEAGIKTHHSGYSTAVLPYNSPMQDSVISLIKQPPTYRPIVLKVVDATNPNNFIRDEVFQFAWQYNFRDGEISVISAYSALVPFGVKDSPENAVTVTMNSTELIEQDVQSVDLVVRYGNVGGSFIAHTWDKNNTEDALAISNHNSGTPLTYNFLNDAIGVPIDSAHANKPFESVPLSSKTLEVARNRVFFGNNLFGYNTPSKSSLTAQVINAQNTSGDFHLGNWRIINIIRSGNGPDYIPYRVYYFQMPINPNLYVFENLKPPAIPPTTIDLSTSSHQSTNIAEIYHYLLFKYINPLPSDHTYSYTFSQESTSYTAITATTTTSSLPEGTPLFKINSSYSISIAFYDKFRRKCGVVTTKVNLQTKDRTYGLMVFNLTVVWTLDNTNALTEIPIWAYYYQILITKNGTADFFIQDRSRATVYVKRDPTTKALTYTETANFTYSDDAYAIGLDISPLFTNGLGYTFTEGDVVRIYQPYGSVTHQLRIIGQYGDYIHVQLKDIGPIQGPVLYEIYTPYQRSATESYYEASDMLPINGAGTGGRQYTFTSGYLVGDVYWTKRKDTVGQDYFVEAMSMNVDKWKQWERELGWPNVVDHIGQQKRPQSIAFSDKYLPGTRTNGLSSFNALNVSDVPLENGDIQRLQLTAKVQDEGSVMLAICSNETTSIYLGETQVTSSSGNAFLATSDGVIGTMNSLKGLFGTLHPESVQEYQGNVYWWDVYNGSIVQYSVNGLFPVGNYKMTRFFKRYAKKYLSSNMTAPMLSGLDPYNHEYLLVMPAVETSGFAGTLPTVSRPNEFNFYDGVAKTVTYKIGMDKFLPPYSFLPECLDYIGTQMFGFKGGVLYRHNDESAIDNNFYGVQYTSKIAFLSNSTPAKLKLYATASVQGNMAPTYTLFYTTYPNEQITDLLVSDYRNREGEFEAPLYRDRLSPNVSGSADQKLFTGDKIRTSALKVLMEFNTTTQKMQLKFVNIGYHLVAGHNT